MRVLVTGAESFTARYLIPLLERETEYEIWGTDLPSSGRTGASYRPADLTRGAAIDEVVAEADPELVFHLAGVSSGDEDRCFAVNLEGTRNLLRACADRSRPPRVLVVSSAAVYGHTRPEETPVTEETPLRPVSAYGASKAAAEAAALSRHRRGLLEVLVVRPFNLVGPGLPPGLAPSDFAEQVRRIRDGGGGSPIRVGNLTPRRDFVDVRDAVRAYVLLARDRELFGRIFNVGTGRPVAIQSLLDELIRLAGLDVRVETDPRRFRPVDVEEQIADIGSLRREVSWTPTIPLQQSLRDMLEEGP
jgi:GDP-4-dehydro-6-deoxy-D-mannose reductase